MSPQNLGLHYNCISQLPFAYCQWGLRQPLPTNPSLLEGGRRGRGPRCGCSLPGDALPPLHAWRLILVWLQLLAGDWDHAHTDLDMVKGNLVMFLGPQIDFVHMQPQL